jgi:hypothetical protein
MHPRTPQDAKQRLPSQKGLASTEAELADSDARHQSDTQRHRSLLHSVMQLWRCYNVSRRKKALGFATKDSRRGRTYR